MKLLTIILVALILTGCTTYAPKQITLDDLEGVPVTDEGGLTPSLGIEKFNKPYDFTVMTIDGNEFNLYNNIESHKPTVVYFFATWCPYCAKDFEALKSVYPAYKDRVDFIVIDMDLNEDAKLIREYRDKNNHLDLVFSEGKESILKDYSVTRTTQKYAVNRDGFILWEGSGELDEETWEIIFKGLVNQ